MKQKSAPEQNKEEQEEENLKQKTEHEQTQADNQEVLEVRAMDEKAKTHEERAADVARVVAKAGKTSGTMHTMYGKGAMKDAEKVRKSHKERSADASRKVAESRAHRITVLEPPKEKLKTFNLKQIVTRSGQVLMNMLERLLETTEIDARDVENITQCFYECLFVVNELVIHGFVHADGEKVF